MSMTSDEHFSATAIGTNNPTAYLVAQECFMILMYRQSGISMGLTISLTSCEYGLCVRWSMTHHTSALCEHAVPSGTGPRWKWRCCWRVQRQIGPCSKTEHGVTAQALCQMGL